MRTSRVILPLLVTVLLAACGAEAPTTPTGGSGTGTSTDAPATPGTTPTTTPATTAPDTGSSDTGAPDTGSSDTGSPETASPTSTPGTGIEDPTLLPTAGGTAAPVTLTGVPTAGVEPNCWLLDGYLLIGGPTELIAAGQPLTVTGRPDPDLMTTCQQGNPLRVESATSAG